MNDQITELKQELARQKEMVSYFRRIFQSIPDGMLCADTERRIIRINKEMESLFGYREDELLGQQTDLLYSSREEFEQLGKERFNLDALEAGKPFVVSCRKKDGTIFSAETVGTLVRDEDGGPICFIKLMRDISERKELEKSLRELEVKFRTIADFTYDWECWIKRDGSFHYVSPACKRITGYSVDDFMEYPSLFRDIIIPEDRELWDKHLHDTRKKSILREVQFRIVRRDGEVRWIEHACQPVIGEQEELLGLRSSNRDITKRKNYEFELRDALVQIERYKEQLEAETTYLRQEIKLSHNHQDIVGSSNALQYVFFKIEQIAITDTSVLLLGETGTGKELFAQAIHDTSLRKDRPLVKINCATLPANLIESELFGHEKGSFTSAYARQIGRFEIADKGTIFLDEIGEIPLELQAKLLRVLQAGEFERLGGSRTISVDVRVIAATNRDLEEDVRQGVFRKDLWYRLNVFPITAPPLRDRIEDIPQLVRYFTERFAKKQRKEITSIPIHVIKKLESYPWPGNVRELENVIERAVINTSGSRLNLVDDLQQPLDKMPDSFPTLAEMEREYITKVLEKTKWKVSGKNSASEILGLKRSTLRARMEKYKIDKP